MNNYVIAPTDSDLQHHGILGMRWGRKNGPPYPLDGPDHSSSEKKAGWRKSLGGGGLFKRKKKKNPDAKVIAQERLKALQTENPSLYEAKKQTALQKGKASDVLKFQGNLTNQQLQDAIDRLNKEATLKSMSDADKIDTWKKIDNYTSKMDTLVSAADVSLKAYNVLARVSNAKATQEGGWPIVPGGGGDGKKKKK